VNLEWIDSEEVEVHGPERYLSDVDGILVPGGFGYRGIEGKIESVRYARKKRSLTSGSVWACSVP